MRTVAILAGISALSGCVLCIPDDGNRAEATPLPWEMGGSLESATATAELEQSAPNPDLEAVVEHELNEENGAVPDSANPAGVDVPSEERNGDSDTAGDVGPVDIAGVVDPSTGEVDATAAGAGEAAAAGAGEAAVIPSVPGAGASITASRLNDVLRRVENADRSNKLWGFDLKVDSALSSSLSYWRSIAGRVTREKAGHMCEMKEKPDQFEIAIDQLVASFWTENAPSILVGGRAPERETTPSEEEAMAEDTSEPGPDAIPDNRDNDAARIVATGERAVVPEGRTPTREEAREAAAGPDAVVREVEAAAGGSADVLLQRIENARSDLHATITRHASEGYDDVDHDTVGLGMHSHTAHHAIRRLLRALREDDGVVDDHELPGGDLLFEGYEHETSFKKGEDALPGVSGDGRIQLANGVSVTYGEVIALAGDFYGDPECPISTGPVDSDVKGGLFSSLPTRTDGREYVVKEVYKVCGWSYDERKHALSDKCPTTSAHGRTAVQRRFVNAYNTLNYGKKAELKKILELFKVEHKRIRGPSSATVDYLDAGNDLNFEYAKATGSELMAMPRPFGVAPVGGRFIDLAGVNWDHFGRGGWNKQVYIAGHKEAMRLAAQAKLTRDKTLLARAYLVNAYADHFLTDQFSSGHYRNLRRELHDCCTVSSVGGNLPWGDLLAKYQHDEDNFYGLKMTSEAEGKSWKAYGDKMWFTPSNVKGREVAQRAVAMSIKEVADAYESGVAGESQMTRYLPKETDERNNLRPLFKKVSGDLVIRTPMDDPFNAEPEYTTNFVGMSSYFKLRRIAFEREFWYKYEHPAVPDATTDAIRFFSAHDGAGTDEMVMVELLALRTNEHIKAMKRMYTAAYPGRNIVNDAKADTSGDFENLLVHMLRATKKEGSISSSEASSLARQLYDAGEDRVFTGTDEAKFISILGGNSMQRNKKIAEAYRRISDMTLRQAIESETSGAFKDGLLHLVPKDTQTEHDWAAAAADRIHKAMSGWGTNEYKLASTLRKYDNRKLRQVQKAYEAKFNKAIRGEIESETSLGTETCMVKLLSTGKSEGAISDSTASSKARALYKAGEDKWGTDENAFINILCGTSRANAAKIKAAYGRLSQTKMSLAAAIRDEMSGDLQACILGCIA